MYETLAVLAGFALVYSAVAGRIEKTWVSGPMIFTAFGLVIGPLGFGLLSPARDPELLKTLAELTLALVLFTDAAGANLGVLRRTSQLPIRLLGIGLPLTMLLGFGVGVLLFGSMPLVEVALLAVMLAPTDAALGRAVVANKAVPDPVRQALNAESGLNDGICVPVLFLFLALVEWEEGQGTARQIALRLLVEEIGIGAGCGLVLAAGGAWLLGYCRRNAWVSPAWNKISIVALAFASFGAAQALGGSGFIACFLGGLLFGRMLKPRDGHYLDAAEGIGDTFALLTWVLFGAAVIGQVIGSFTWTIVLYAALSLTVIRMMPVFISLLGLGLSTESKLFVGWFGPRGLASIVFAVIVLEADISHGGTIALVVVCTVIMSVLAHGASANIWARGYGARANANANAHARANASAPAVTGRSAGRSEA